MVLPVALLLYQYLHFNLLQDDAFISFRYVQNFLDGHGLVFNVGERVEGYTNFFWIILLALLTKLGFPLVYTARFLGIGLVFGTLFITFWTAWRHYHQRGLVWILGIPLILAANGSMAYWAGSGLETSLFTFLVALSAVLYYWQPALALPCVVLAALTRPEGTLLAFLLGLIGPFFGKGSWKSAVRFWGWFLLVMLPYAVFKWFYFGSVLPNPFYAKTSFSLEYLQSGLEYFFLFLKQYGFYGLGLLLPFMLWKKLEPFSRICLFVFAGYSLYLILVGGDVLKAHRFFMPVLVFFYFPLADSFFQLSRKGGYANFVFGLVVLAVATCSYQFPRFYLTQSADLEKRLVAKMGAVGHFFADDTTVQTIALSTIGAFSYEAGRRRIIDMLGLTDATIARKPEKIEGFESTWKERNFNAGYVLSQKPDVIQFSTGYKPSAPAERALFLYPDFRRNYRPEFSYEGKIFNVYYRRFQNHPTNHRPDGSPEFVNLFTQGADRISKNAWEGLLILKKALARGPKDCAVIYGSIGFAYMATGPPESTEVYLKKAMELDSGGSLARYYYSTFLSSHGRHDEAKKENLILWRKVPNYVNFLRSTGAIRDTNTSDH